MIAFEKWHGAGNDFVIVDDRGENGGLGRLDLGGFARQVCDRHFGVGADGLLIAVAGDGVAVAMRMFNPDGSEAEMCGNGLRCFARWLWGRGEIGVGLTRIGTGAGLLGVTVADGGAISVDMGYPILHWSDIPVRTDFQGTSGWVTLRLPGWDASTLEATAVSMGNPHAVVFVQDVSKVPLEEIGPLLEVHQVFPRRANIEFCEVVSKSKLRVRVWERGAGVTLACGTGACAVMVAARLHGLVSETAVLELPGGNLEATWAGSASDAAHPVHLTGPTEKTFTGEWSLLLPRR